MQHSSVEFNRLDSWPNFKNSSHCFIYRDYASEWCSFYIFNGNQDRESPTCTLCASVHTTWNCVKGVNISKHIFNFIFDSTSAHSRKHDLSPYSAAYKTNYNLSSSLGAESPCIFILDYLKHLHKWKDRCGHFLLYKAVQKLLWVTLPHVREYLKHLKEKKKKKKCSLWSFLSKKVPRAFTQNLNLNRF